MRPLAKGMLLPIVGALALVGLAYANHFGNSLHFDDSHTITDNPSIRDLRSIPRFFVDPDAFSTLPANRAWRPVLSTSLAIDYWLGGGLSPTTWFHVSTFFWYLVQLALTFQLFRWIFDCARPDPRNDRVALLAATLYGVHPVMAETVNYVIQRGDLYATLGVIAGLVLYIARPALRRFGIYLVPVALGLLSKPPALIFPAILASYLMLFERETLSRALRRSLPSIAVVVAFAVATKAVMSASYDPGAPPQGYYRMTQPLVALRYFRTFWLPTDLTADTDFRPAATLLEPGVWIGVLFVAGMLAVATACARRREWRPVAFGILWFFLGMLPTSLFPLAEVQNDHRMYFPFVGLMMATCWAAELRLASRRLPGSIVATACATLLAAAAFGTWQRNEVWRTEETLWQDVVEKSPKNGRGLMNYGVAEMAAGRYASAIEHFERASALSPNYHLVDVNLGVAYGAIGEHAKAEARFRRAIELKPADASSRYFYARWLRERDRRKEAVEQLQIAVRANPDYTKASSLLMTTLFELDDPDGVGKTARAVLARFPSDPEARSWLAKLDAPATPEALLERSLRLYREKRFEESLQAARAAVAQRPGYAEAWNNVGAANNAMERWDDGIAACREAVRLKPDFELAKNNLAWALAQKAKADAARRDRRPPES